MSSALRNIIYTLRTNVPLSDLASSPFTVVIASFLLPEPDGTVTASSELQDFIADPSLISSIKASGTRKVLVSLGGENVPAGGWKGLAADTTKAAASIWDFVHTHGFDGVDFDYEDTAAFSDPKAAGYDPVDFLADISMAVKKAAGSSGCIVTHAPQPPYLYPGAYPAYPDGPYQAILAKCGDAIDWLNVQYYNNGWYVGTTAAEQAENVAGLTKGIPFPSSIIALSATIPVEKLVLGRITSTENGGSGYLSADQTASALVKPLVKKFGANFGGVMGWQFSLSPSGSGTADAWGETIQAALES